MAKGEVIGHVACPLCGLEAEVKTDKNGNPYVFCPDCTCQVLTHGGPRADLLRRRMRPVGQAEEAAAEEVPAEVPAPAAAQAQRRNRFMGVGRG